MGFAVAARAAGRGANVTLVAGPVALPTPPGVDRIDVETTQQMQAALDAALGGDLRGADALVMAAAVADFRPLAPSSEKIKKGAGEAAPVIQLARNPDLIAAIAARRAGPLPVLVAFALETGDDATVLAYAQTKLHDKKVDIVVANAAHESLGQAHNRVAIVAEKDVTPFTSASKEDIADLILDRIADRWSHG
jgi:phosphopantothenoylcysteine decarboxylase/phosphopantothenate--cysteine ligase